MRPFDNAMVFTNDLPFRRNHQPVGIDPQADRPVGKSGRHAVAVALKMDQAG